MTANQKQPYFTRRALLLIILIMTVLLAYSYIKPLNYISYYVSPTTISPELIAPPTLVKSAEWNAEVTAIRKLQKNAAKDLIMKADDEDVLTPEHFTAVLGGSISRDHYPKTYELMKKVKNDCELSVHYAKKYWHTTRPYLSEVGVSALISKKDSYSYPSGHTACSRVWAEVLSQLVPERRADLRMKAKESANYRVIGGMHWPHDLVGGEQLALLFIGALQTSASYQHDLKSAQAEWVSKQEKHHE